MNNKQFFNSVKFFYLLAFGLSLSTSLHAFVLTSDNPRFDCIGKTLNSACIFQEQNGVCAPAMLKNKAKESVILQNNNYLVCQVQEQNQSSEVLYKVFLSIFVIFVSFYAFVTLRKKFFMKNNEQKPFYFST